MEIETIVEENVYAFLLDLKKKRKEKRRQV